MASLSGAWDDIKNFLSGAKNALEGDPNSATDAMSQLQQKAYAQGNQIKNFLMQQKQQSEQYYKPMQQMFGNMYGTGGLMPAKAPTAAGGGTPGGGTY